MRLVTIPLALLGMKVLWLLMGWLLNCIVASYLSERKGFGGKPGQATAMVLPIVGIIIWLAIPPKDDSDWKQYGITGSTRRA